MANEKKSKYPFKLSGYVYSKGTRAGFLRMKRMGIPRPLFRIEDKLAKVVRGLYRELVRKMLQDIKRAAADVNVTLDNAPEENLEELISFFDEKKQEQADVTKTFTDRANMGAAENTLQHLWFDVLKDDINIRRNQRTENKLVRLLTEEQDDYLIRLFDDAGTKMQSILQSFSIDKQQLFNENMEGLKKLYLDNSIQRLTWEENDIKRRVLKRIHDYVTGQSDTLKFDDLTKYAFNTGDHLSRLFARDQMQRFNKAMTLVTYINAGVTKVKWITAHDARVRKSHKELDGQVFNINELPKEVDDYNCRCGLIPVEWEE